MTTRISTPTWVLVSIAIATIASNFAPAYGQDADRENVRVAQQPESPVTLEPLRQSGADSTGTAVSDEPTAADQAKAAESLKRRAGEQVADDARGRAVVLGMYLQEADSRRVKVVEVGAASPAFDAGVREGDELLSYHGFSAKTYRKWIDGMREPTADAPENATIPVVVWRDGKRMALHIRVPEKKADDPRLPGVLAQQVGEQQQAPAAGAAAFPVPGGVGNDNDVFIGNTGLFADFFGGRTGGATERAMAELFRVGGQTQPGIPVDPTVADTRAGQRVNPQTAANGANPNGAARIGLAGFRNDATGLLIMVDVGGLEPGNYDVRIGEVGSPAAAAGATVPSNVGTVPQAVPIQNAPAPGAGQLPADNAPAVQPSRRTQPQSRLEPRVKVLAQVAGTTPGVGDSSPATTIPSEGKAKESGATPTGQSRVNNALRDRNNQANTATSQNAAGASTLNEIGVLTVDESGTGRMQQVVEGVSVRDVVGQSILIYSQSASPQTTLPPNLDPTVDPATAPKVNDPNRAGGVQNVGGQPQQGAVQSPDAPGTASVDSRMPVASGVIRILSDRRPGTSGSEEQGTEQPIGSGVGQPTGIQQGVARDSLQ